MIPIHFGTQQRRLFGIYQPPLGEGTAVRAAVLCHPWGAEHLFAYRTMRFLAGQLANAGIHTLRFDYFGTGDSGGETTEGDLQGWQGDVATALDEIKAMAGTQRIALVGLRMGAYLAAQMAVKHPDMIDALVLWDPVVSGREYLERLFCPPHPRAGQCSEPRARSHEVGGGHEVDGFPISAGLADDMRAIELSRLVRQLSVRTLLVTTESLPSHASLRDAMGRGPAAEFTDIELESVRPWYEQPDLAGAIAVRPARRIVEWLAS